MIIKSAEYVISAHSKAQWPQEEIPEVAFVGRSNVGKSSLINSLLNRKTLARTSSKPGKTQSINFFNINNHEFHFVDLPGYGFAKVSKDIKVHWGKMIEEYLRDREFLAAVIHLIDIRHEPTRDDINMYQWLQHFNIPTIVVATKADKISRGTRPKHLKAIKQGLQMEKDNPLLAYSAETREGKEELWQLLKHYMGMGEQQESH